MMPSDFFELHWIYKFYWGNPGVCIWAADIRLVVGRAMLVMEISFYEFWEAKEDSPLLTMMNSCLLSTYSLEARMLLTEPSSSDSSILDIPPVIELLSIMISNIYDYSPIWLSPNLCFTSRMLHNDSLCFLKFTFSLSKRSRSFVRNAFFLSNFWTTS